jgi:hypothetical protein
MGVIPKTSDTSCGKPTPKGSRVVKPYRELRISDLVAVGVPSHLFVALIWTAAWYRRGDIGTHSAFIILVGMLILVLCGFCWSAALFVACRSLVRRARIASARRRAERRASQAGIWDDQLDGPGSW